MPVDPPAGGAGAAPGDGDKPKGSQLTAYFNGEFMPLDRAARSMREAGLESAGGFYDVERTFGGSLYRLDDHLDRLYSGLAHTGMDPGLPREQMARLTRSLVADNYDRIDPGRDFLVTQIVSAGPSGQDSRDGAASDGPTAPVNVAIYCQVLNPLPFALSYGYGVRVTTPSTYPVPPSVAPHRQLTFPLMNDVEGNVTECSGGNFMFVSGGRVKLPDRSGVLPGISMKTVLELADGLGIGVDEGDYCTGDVYLADEAFVSSTRFCMLPVSTVNGLGIGAELPGPITRSILDAWIDEAGFDFVGQALNQAAAAGML